jgi:hypothetical protein
VLVVVMMMVVMMVVGGSEYWTGKHHQEQRSGKNLLHGKNLARGALRRKSKIARRVKGGTSGEEAFPVRKTTAFQPSGLRLQGGPA